MLWKGLVQLINSVPLFFQGMANCAAISWILIPGDLANNALYCGAYLNSFFTSIAANNMAVSGTVRRESSFLLGHDLK